MDEVEEKIHRLSQAQLHTLLLFSKSKTGIISPSKSLLKPVRHWVASYHLFHGSTYPVNPLYYLGEKRIEK